MFVPYHLGVRQPMYAYAFTLSKYFFCVRCILSSSFDLFFWNWHNDIFSYRRCPTNSHDESQHCSVLSIVRIVYCSRNAALCVIAPFHINMCTSKYYVFIFGTQSFLTACGAYLSFYLIIKTKLLLHLLVFHLRSFVSYELFVSKLNSYFLRYNNNLLCYNCTADSHLQPHRNSFIARSTKS